MNNLSTSTEAQRRQDALLNGTGKPVQPTEAQKRQDSLLGTDGKIKSVSDKINSGNSCNIQ